MRSLNINDHPLIVSFSGGRTSAFMSYMLMQNLEEKPTFIFANTGKENEETLHFVNECDKRWGLDVIWIESIIDQEKGVGARYKIVDFETASRNGEPFDDMIKKFDIPNKDFPHCTRELKTVPIYKFTRENIGTKYRMAIGIRADETHRINLKRAAKNQWVYPLIFDFRITKNDIRSFWSNQDFDLQIEDYMGNCDLCWKKSQKKRKKIMMNHPEKVNWWKHHENNSEYVFDRDKKTIDEIYKEAIIQSSQAELFTYDDDDNDDCSCFS